MLDMEVGYKKVMNNLFNLFNLLWKSEMKEFKK